MTSDPGDTQASAPPEAEAFCATCNTSYPPTTQFCPTDGARLVRFSGGADPLVGRVIEERFEVQQRIGRGGMGAVYRAWQRSVDREVAIKVIDARLSTDRVAAKRFLREARLASRLSHPAIVVVYDFGQTDDGVLYLAMEMLRGKTLAQAIGGKPVTPRRTIKLALQLCDALEAAHRQDIVHRDLKPQNVVILDEPPGRDLVKVLDFGLAKSLVHDDSAVTKSDAILGTPLYMAPEAIRGDAVGPRADLYSLGCILYELLAGVPPFLAQTPNMVLAKHLSDPPPPLPATVPAPLVEVVEGLLAKDAKDRPDSATVVRDRLQHLLDAGASLDRMPSVTAKAPAAFADTLASPMSAAPVPPGTQTGLALDRSRSRWPLWAGLGIAAAIAGVVAMFAMRGGDDPPARAIAPDAAVRAVPPASPDAPVPDATPPDAAVRALPIDAGRRGGRAPKLDAAVVKPPPPPIDAAVAKPPPPTTPIDARPDVDFILPSKK